MERAIKIGVGAVVFRGGDALLIRRGKPPFLGQWSIPGGKIRHGEALEDAVRREVLEETGVEMRLIGLLGVFEALPGPSPDHFVMIDYAAEWVKGEPVAGDDAAAAEFTPLEEAARRVSWDKTRQALAMARALRERAANRL
jgi:8-oxo-dGTP diphosphatase